MGGVRKIILWKMIVNTELIKNEDIIDIWRLEKPDEIKYSGRVN